MRIQRRDAEVAEITPRKTIFPIDSFRRKLNDKPGRLKGVCRKNEFLCANSVMLCVSVVKFQEKHSPQRHGAYTENHGRLFPTDS